MNREGSSASIEHSRVDLLVPGLTLPGLVICRISQGSLGEKNL